MRETQAINPPFGDGFYNAFTVNLDCIIFTIGFATVPSGKLT